MWPKRLFTLGGGLYAAGTLATGAVLLTGAGGGVRLRTVVVAGFVGALCGGVVAGRQTLATIEQFQGRRWEVVGLFGVPTALLVAVLAGHWQLAVAVFWPAMTGVFATLAGTVGMAHAAERQHVRRLTTESEATARLPGPYTGLKRRYGRVVLAGGVPLVALYCYVLWLLIDGTTSGWVYLVMNAGAVPLGYQFIANPDYVAVSEGLVRGVSVESWDRYEGFELTDEALLLHMKGSNRNRHRFPLSDIDDPRAVTHALSRYLRPKQTDW